MADLRVKWGHTHNGATIIKPEASRSGLNHRPVRPGSVVW